MIPVHIAGPDVRLFVTGLNSSPQQATSVRSITRPHTHIYNRPLLSDLLPDPIPISTVGFYCQVYYQTPYPYLQ